MGGVVEEAFLRSDQLVERLTGERLVVATLAPGPVVHQQYDRRDEQDAGDARERHLHRP